MGRWATIIMLAVFAVLLTFAGFAFWPEVQREMPQTAGQIHAAAAFVKALPGAVPDAAKLVVGVFFMVSALYIGFAYFLGAWSGIKRF